jgi:hypothetical protein
MAQSSTVRLSGVLINSYGKECPMLRSFAVRCIFAVDCVFQGRKPNIKRGLIMVLTLLCKVFDIVTPTLEVVLN